MGQLKSKKKLHLSVPTTQAPCCHCHCHSQCCHNWHCHRVLSFPAMEKNDQWVASTKVAIKSFWSIRRLNSASQEPSCSCRALLWPPGQNCLTQNSLVASLTDKLTAHLLSHAKAAWWQAHSQAGRESCRCAALASPQARPSAGQSSAERWGLAGLPARGRREAKCRPWWKRRRQGCKLRIFW